MVAQGGEVGVVLPAGEVVDDGQLRPLGEQPAGQVGADEPGPAEHERALSAGTALQRRSTGRPYPEAGVGDPGPG